MRRPAILADPTRLFPLWTVTSVPSMNTTTSVPPASTLLVLGGARSGKSHFAQTEAERRRSDRLYIATAEVRDAEMAERVALHVAARSNGWQTLEVPYDLPAMILREARSSRILLIDCLTLWLSNLLLRGDDLESAGAELVAAVGRVEGGVIFVSNEVGSGIVPDNALARRFRDAQGRLNQAVAAACEEVVLVVAGLPLIVKKAAG